MATHEPKHDNLHKELDLIQDVIKRMAQNSFQVRSWLMGILSALVVIQREVLLGDKEDFSPVAALFLLLPVLSFWYLDAFFLSTERLYRELYKWVVKYRPHTQAYQYDLNTFVREAQGERVNLVKPGNGVWRVLFSRTLLPFYMAPLLFVLGLLLYGLL